MDGQPLLLLFSVYIVWHISTARRCGKPAPFLPPRPAADLIAGLLCGAFRRYAHKRIKGSSPLFRSTAAKRARKREKLSIGRSGTNRAHKFADGKTVADDKTQLGRHIWQHTVIFWVDTPKGAARLRALLSSNWFHCYWQLFGLFG